jgi:hypothetical protein
MLESLVEKDVVVHCSFVFNMIEGFLKEQKTVKSIGLYDMYLYNQSISCIYRPIYIFFASMF